MWLWQRDGAVGGHGVIHTGPRPTAAEDGASERVPGPRDQESGERCQAAVARYPRVWDFRAWYHGTDWWDFLPSPATSLAQGAQASQRCQDRFLPLCPQKRGAPPRAGQIQMKALSALPKLAVQLGEAQRSTDRWDAGVTAEASPLLQILLPVFVFIELSPGSSQGQEPGLFFFFPS